MSLQLQTPLTWQVPNSKATAQRGTQEPSTHLLESLPSMYPLHSYLLA